MKKTDFTHKKYPADALLGIGRVCFIYDYVGTT